MSKDERKKYERIIVFLSVLGLVLLVGFITWGSIQIGKMKSIIANIDVPKIVQGINGKDGNTPIKGVDYIDGRNGSSGNNGASIKGDQGIQGIQGEKGDKGDTGETGAQGVQGEQGITILIRTNPDTGKEECKALTDTDWQPISECI